MYFKDAWEIIRKHNAIPRRISKQILRAIVDGDSLDEKACQPFLSVDEIERIRKDYEVQRDALIAEGVEILPRNLPFYHLIQQKIPDFDWTAEEADVTRGTHEVHFKRPSLEGVRPSLLTLLTREIPTETTSSLHEMYGCTHRYPPALVHLLSRLLETNRFVSPDEATVEYLLTWMQRAVDGVPSQVISPICPDYKADKLGKHLYRFTFDGVGDKVGVVGQRWLSALPLVSEFLEGLDAEPTIIAAIGDFEGFPDGALERLGVTWDEFEARLRRSQLALQAECPVAIEAPLFTELCGGRATWDKMWRKNQARIVGGDYGGSGLTEPELRQIAESRAPLYRRWLQKRGDFDFMETLLNQGAEYATMGQIVQEKMSNPLVIGADHGRMSPFYNVSSDVPVLYIRNNYVNVS